MLLVSTSSEGVSLMMNRISVFRFWEVPLSNGFKRKLNMGILTFFNAMFNDLSKLDMDHAKVTALL